MDQTELTLDNLKPSPSLSIPLQIKEYLDAYGIKYTWLSTKLGHERSWCTDLFKGRFQLSEEKLKTIEVLLKVKFKKP